MQSETGTLAVERLGLPLSAYAGQVVLITGAGGGIGLEMARAYARLGARVVIAELDEASGALAEARVRAEGGQALFARVDVSDPEAAQGLARRVRAEWGGGVDLLINNAIYCPAALVEEMDLATFDRVIAVNLRGAFLMTRAFLPEMLQRGQGMILNMVSVDAMPGLSAYIASKQGLVGFTQSLAVEVGARGVKVLAFAPGMVDTPGIRGVAPRLAPRLGVTEEQFLNLSLHAAYSGLMPAGDAAAAAVYLTARLADEAHGQLMNGYEVLERAGLIAASAVDAPTTAPAPALAPEPGPATGGAGSMAAVNAAASALLRTLRDTEAELAKMPVFARPMARNGFKSKAGRGLGDWQAAMELVVELSQGSGGASRDRLRTEAVRLLAGFDGLAGYYRGVPAELARFTRDRDVLAEVNRVSAEREAAVWALKAALETCL